MRALAVIRRTLALAEAVLDAPARLRAGVRRLDAVAVRLLDPPQVACERVPTVPEGLQHRLAADDAQRERVAQLLSSLTMQGAEIDARLERIRQEHFEAFPNLN